MLASATLNSSLGSQIADGNRDRDLVAAALSLLTRIFVRIAPEIPRGLPHPGWSACIALIAPWVTTRFSFFTSTFSVNRHGRFRASAIFRRIARRAPLLSS
jgi:hypothetical protein